MLHARVLGEHPDNESDDEEASSAEGVIQAHEKREGGHLRGRGEAEHGVHEQAAEVRVRADPGTVKDYGGDRRLRSHPERHPQGAQQLRRGQQSQIRHPGGRTQLRALLPGEECGLPQAIEERAAAAAVRHLADIR